MYHFSQHSEERHVTRTGFLSPRASTNDEKTGFYWTLALQPVTVEEEVMDDGSLVGHDIFSSDSFGVIRFQNMFGFPSHQVACRLIGSWVLTLLFTGCGDVVFNRSSLMGRWESRNVRLDIDKNGALHTNVNGFISHGTYEYVGLSGRKAIATGVGQNGQTVELNLLTPRSLQIKMARFPGGTDQTVLLHTMILKRPLAER
jgi:hypothetical protein